MGLKRQGKISVVEPAGWHSYLPVLHAPESTSLSKRNEDAQFTGHTDVQHYLEVNLLLLFPWKVLESVNTYRYVLLQAEGLTSPRLEISTFVLIANQCNLRFQFWRSFIPRKMEIQEIPSIQMREEGAVNDSWTGLRVGLVMPTPLQHCMGSAQHQGLLQWGQSTSAAASRPGRQGPGRRGCLWLLSSWAAPGPVHSSIFLGLRSGSWRHGADLRKSSSRCTGTHLCCALLSKELPAGSISRNASLDYLLLLDSPDRGEKKALSLLWNIWIQEYLVPAKAQTSCGNTHKWQGKDNSLSVKFLYLHRVVPWEKAESSNLNNKRNDLIPGGQHSSVCTSPGPWQAESTSWHRHFWDTLQHIEASQQCKNTL